jgi:hypothetical protein
MKTCLVTYHSYSEFKLPDDVYLLSDECNTQDNKVVGSWWIRWNVFYYVDKDLDVQKVEATAIDTECKVPDEVSWID